MNKKNLFLITILIKYTIRRILYINKFNKNNFINDISYKRKIIITNNLKYSKFNNKKEIRIKDYNEDVYPLF